MIGYLQGQIIEKNPPEVILLAGGVGYELSIPLSAFDSLNSTDEARLYVHTHVREDALQLFGFLSLADRHLFQTLLKVNGIGAKMALTILSSMNRAELMAAINSENIAALTRLPGVGTKTASRMLLDLRGKLAPKDTAATPQTGHAGQAIAALCALGYKTADAEKLIAKVEDLEAPVSEIIKKALQAAR